MKYLVALGFIFISLSASIAQSDYREGYVINNSNDTIYGLIDYKGDMSISKRCKFKKDIDSESQVFAPEDIMGFRFTDGKYLISKSVNTEDGPKQLFLEYLVNAAVDIYYYRDDEKRCYFVEDSLGQLYELKKEEVKVIVNNVEYVREDKKYIGVLKVIFEDSPSVSEKLEHIGLNHKSLISIAGEYQKEVCPDEECIIYEKKMPKVKKSFGVIAGVNKIYMSRIFAKYPPGIYYLTGTHFDFSYSPVIGMFYKVNMPFFNENVYSQIELSYSKIDLDASGFYYKSALDLTYQNRILLKQQAIGALCALKYESPKGKVKPTFQAGAFFNYFFGSDYLREVGVVLSSGEVSHVGYEYDNCFENLDLGINCGIGLKTLYKNDKELFVDFRYQRGFLFLTASNTNIFSVNIGLQIGK